MHTRFKSFVIGALMLNVTAFKTTTQTRDDDFTESAISKEKEEEFIGR